MISRSRSESSVAVAAPPRTMLERISPFGGTRFTAPANSPSMRMIRLSPSITFGRKRWTTRCSARRASNSSSSAERFGSSRPTLNTAAPPLP